MKKKHVLVSVLVVVLIAGFLTVFVGAGSVVPPDPDDIPQADKPDPERAKRIWAWYAENRPEIFPSASTSKGIGIRAVDPSEATLYEGNFKEDGDSGSCGAWDEVSGTGQSLPDMDPAGCGDIEWAQSAELSGHDLVTDTWDYMLDVVVWVEDTTGELDDALDDGWFGRLFYQVDGVTYGEDEALECVYGSDYSNFFDGNAVGCISPNWAHVDTGTEGMPWVSNDIWINWFCPMPNWPWITPDANDCDEVSTSTWDVMTATLEYTPYHYVLNDGEFTSSTLSTWWYEGHWKKGNKFFYNDYFCDDEYSNCPSECAWYQSDTYFDSTYTSSCLGGNASLYDSEYPSPTPLPSAAADLDVDWDVADDKNITCKFEAADIYGLDEPDVVCTWYTDAPGWRSCSFDPDSETGCSKWLASGITNITKWRVQARELDEYDGFVILTGKAKAYQKGATLASSTPDSVTLDPDGGKIVKYADHEYGDDWDLRPQGEILATVTRPVTGGEGDIKIELRYTDSDPVAYESCTLEGWDVTCTMSPASSEWESFDFLRVTNLEASDEVTLNTLLVRMDSWCPRDDMGKTACDKNPNEPPWVMPHP